MYLLTMVSEAYAFSELLKQQQQQELKNTSSCEILKIIPIEGMTMATILNSIKKILIFYIEGFTLSSRVRCPRGGL